MTTTTHHSASDRAAALVLFFTLPIVFVLLLLGWQRLFLSSIPHGVRLVAWPAAAFLAFSAIILARAVASERVRLESAEAKTARDRTWWGYFAFLLSISTLGTLSAVVYYGEGNQVMIENLDSAQACLTRFETAAATLVTTAVYDDTKAQVDRLQSAIENEIRNGRNCGDGPATIAIINEMKRYLPAYRRLSGRSSNCEGLDDLIGQYRQMRDEQLPQADTYRTDRVAEKSVLREALPDVFKRNRAALASAREELGTSSFGLENARAKVETTMKDITEYGEKARALSTDKFELKCDVRLDDVRGLGSFWQVIPVLMSRADRPSTYVYVAFAVAVDILMVSFFVRVIRGTRERRRHPREPGGSGSVGGSKPLWVDP